MNAWNWVSFSNTNLDIQGFLENCRWNISYHMILLNPKGVQNVFQKRPKNFEKVQEVPKKSQRYPKRSQGIKKVPRIPKNPNRFRLNRLMIYLQLDMSFSVRNVYRPDLLFVYPRQPPHGPSKWYQKTAQPWPLSCTQSALYRQLPEKSKRVD